jgi:hypothetical protein
MTVEFQIRAAALLAAMKAALQATRICPAPVTIGPVELVIDRVEFGGNALRHDEPADHTVFVSSGNGQAAISVAGRQTQFAQEVIVWVTTMAEILAHPNGAPAAVVPIGGTVVIDLDVFAVEQETFFQARFNRFEPGALPPLPLPIPSVTVAQLVQLANDQLRVMTARPAVPLGIIEQLPTTPSATLPVNAGLSVDRGQQFVSMRVQVVGGALAADVPWRNFYNGFISERLGGQEWGLFIDEKYVCATIQTALQRAIDEHAPDDLQVFVEANYSNAGGKARIDVVLLGLYDLPDPLGQLSVNPHVPIEVSVPAENSIQIDLGLPDIHTFIRSLIPHWLQLFIRFGGPIGAFVGALIDSKIAEIDEPALPDEIVRTSPTNLRFTRRVDLPAIPNGLGTRLTAVLALEDGFAFVGRFNVHAFTTAPLEVSMWPFELHAPEVDCGGAGMSTVAMFGEHPEWFEILTARIFVQYAGTLPVHICGVTAVNDPLNTFPPNAFQQNEPQANATIVVNPSLPSATYYAAPYPCDVLIRTSVGTRLVRIPPPPVLTSDDLRRMRAEMLIKLGNCLQLVAPWWLYPHGYNPLWSVDPPYYGQVMHLWEVDINGLAQGELVSLIAAGGQTVTTQWTGAQATTHLSALVAPMTLDGGPELSLVRGTPQTLLSAQSQREAALKKVPGADTLETLHDLDKPLPGVNKQGIAVKQTQLLRLGSIPLGEPCRQVRAARIAGRLCVIATLDNRVAAFDVTDPAAPQLLAQWKMHGLRGAEPWGDGVLMFGEDGLRLVDANGDMVDVTPACRDRDVRALAAGRSTLYIAYAREIEAFSRYLSPLGRVALDDCRGVLRVDRQLVAAGRDGIVTFQRFPGREKPDHECHDRWTPTELRPAARRERGAFVAFFADASPRLMRLSGEKLESVGEYASRPWFVDSVRIGPLLVRIVHHALEIDRYGLSAKV